MKSGNAKTISKHFQINFSDYDDYHKDSKCKGQWQFTVTTGRMFTLDAIGPIPVPLIPLVTCHACKTSFEAPKFRELIEEVVARHLIQSNKALTKKQIRFLRLFFNLSQEELAKKIGVADRHEMAKFESEQSQRNLDADRQVRLRLHLSKLLKITDANDIYRINEIDDSTTVTIPQELFPSTEEEVIRRVG